MQTRVLLSPKLTKLKTFGGKYSVRTHNAGPTTRQGEAETSRSSIDNDLWRPKSPWWPHVAPSQTYLAFSFNDNDGHSSGRPAVFGWQGLVTIPQNYDLKRTRIIRWLALVLLSVPFSRLCLQKRPGKTTFQSQSTPKHTSDVQSSPTTEGQKKSKE